MRSRSSPGKGSHSESGATWKSAGEIGPRVGPVCVGGKMLWLAGSADIFSWTPRPGKELEERARRQEGWVHELIRRNLQASLRRSFNSGVSSSCPIRSQHRT
jgi:hypothetical protein